MASATPDSTPPIDQRSNPPRLRGSLRWRLQVWHGLILTAFLAVFAVFGRETYNLAWKSRLQQIDFELDRPAEVIVSRLRRLFPFPWGPGFRAPGNPPNWRPPGPRPENDIANRTEPSGRGDPNNRPPTEPSFDDRPRNPEGPRFEGASRPETTSRTSNGQRIASNPAEFSLLTRRDPGTPFAAIQSPGSGDPQEPVSVLSVLQPETSRTSRRSGNRDQRMNEGGIREFVSRDPGFRDVISRDPLSGRSPLSMEWPKPSLELPEEFQLLFEGPEDVRLYFVVWDREGRVLQKSESAAAEIPFPGLRVGEDRLPIRSVRMRGSYREVIHVNGFDINVLVGRSIAKDIAEHHHSGRLLILAGTIILIGGLIGGWWTTSSAIRPFAEMTAAAESISAQHLSQRIILRETDTELGHLASVLNGTFDRLQAAFEQQRRFTADASHELRTPLSVILATSDLALSRERTTSDYKVALGTCRDAARRMKQLIEGLLVLARFDADAAQLQISPLDLSDIARESVDLINPLATERGIVIETDLRPTPIQGDRDRLAQVIVNLLTNAVRYNVDRGRIRISVSAEGEGGRILVADTGKGISSEDLPHIFERFFRADKARVTTAGSCGLGLSISKTIVEFHGGSISVQSVVDKGTTFEVRLPGTPPAGSAS